MSGVRRWLAVAALVTGMTLPVTAADIARLEWGSFVVVEDSSNGWSETRTASSDDGHSITMTFAALEAKVDAGMSEATSRISGHYDLVQPSFDRYASYHVMIEGHVIKSQSATTRLTVRIGSDERTIEWTGGQAVSEKFTRALDFPAPPNGRLPSPFDVSVEAYAGKSAPTDESYLSVSVVTITASGSKIALNQP